MRTMVYAPSWIIPVEKGTQTFLRFWDTNVHLISAKRPDLMIVKKKKTVKKEYAE